MVNLVASLTYPAKKQAGLSVIPPFMAKSQGAPDPLATRCHKWTYSNRIATRYPSLPFMPVFGVHPTRASTGHQNGLAGSPAVGAAHGLCKSVETHLEVS